MENNIILYSNENEKVSINVTYLNDTFWMPQKAIAELFGCSTDNVSLHLKNIFNSGELLQNSVTEKFSVAASDGKNTFQIWTESWKNPKAKIQVIN